MNNICDVYICVCVAMIVFAVTFVTLLYGFVVDE